jgi:hypothetical protein
MGFLLTVPSYDLDVLFWPVLPRFRCAPSPASVITSPAMSRPCDHLKNIFGISARFCVRPRLDFFLKFCAQLWQRPKAEMPRLLNARDGATAATIKAKDQLNERDGQKSSRSQGIRDRAGLTA